MGVINHNDLEYVRVRRDDHLYWLQPFIREKVLELDENIIILVKGRPRKGKSNVSLSLAWSLREYGFNFPGIAHVVMGTLEFLNLLATNPPEGSVIVYEEAPVEHSNVNWQSKENERLNRILNTFGYKKYVFIMNGVNKNDLDKKARKLIHLTIACQVKLPGRRQVKTQVKWCSYNDEKDEIYGTYFIDDETGEQLSHLYFGKLTGELWTQYSKKKDSYNMGALDHMILEIKNEASAGVKPKVDYSAIINTIKKTPQTYNTIAKIAASFNLPQSRARIIKAQAALA